MRTLLLLRGSPGCGKTTWIEENGLKPYTLSADDIRMLYSAPSLNAAGRYEINQSNDHKVWNTLFNLLETRMTNGEFTVIDATNSKTSEMNRYKELCLQHKYRIFCVDFTDIPIKVAKERNRQREELKRVPEDVIEKMYARFNTQKIPSGITVIKPDELDKIWFKRIDISDYKRVHVIGDVHGCNTALQKYIGDGIKDDECYIFTGDYTDRGIENAEVIKFLLSIYEKPNVLLLEGNHERWLWIWANGAATSSREFECLTKVQLEESNIDKKAVRKLYRRIRQCAYFTYGENVYLITHSGLSTLPNNLTTVATEQMIRNCGRYNESEIVDNSFANNTPDNCYQIHGHRNVKGLPTKVNEKCYNLEGKVEFGGCLRCVDLLPDGSHEIFEIKNKVFKMPNDETITSSNKSADVGDVIVQLRNNKYVKEKPYGNISSSISPNMPFITKSGTNKPQKHEDYILIFRSKRLWLVHMISFLILMSAQKQSLTCCNISFCSPLPHMLKKMVFLVLSHIIMKTIVCLLLLNHRRKVIMPHGLAKCYIENLIMRHLPR